MKASYNLAPLLIAELPRSLTNNGLYPAVKRGRVDAVKIFKNQTTDRCRCLPSWW
ncbi:MAG: hypothetical protein RugAbin2_02357 [Rugosibacter sp.]|nr:hypothetical protein [Rugosibacter sp.]